MKKLAIATAVAALAVAGTASAGNVISNLQQQLDGVAAPVLDQIAAMTLDNQSNQLPAGDTDAAIDLYTPSTGKAGYGILSHIKSAENDDGQLVVTFGTGSGVEGPLKGAVFTFTPIAADGVAIVGGSSQEIVRWDCTFAKGSSVSADANMSAFVYGLNDAQDGNDTINLLPLMPYPFNLCSPAQ